MRRGIIGLVWLSLWGTVAYGQTMDALIQREELRLEDRMRWLSPEGVGVQLVSGILPTEEVFPIVESPCFAIKRITFDGDFFGRFAWTLNQSVKRSGFQSGQCLGAQSINALMTQAQNALISKGYTTTRVLAKPQDLTQADLVLTVVAGRVRYV